MAKYILPFWEEQRGWYEIEADSLDKAKEIVKLSDFTENHEPQYRGGQVEWNIDKMYEQDAEE